MLGRALTSPGYYTTVPDIALEASAGNTIIQSTQPNVRCRVGG